MKQIDLETWNRKDHFMHFSKMDYPQFNICMDIDISNFLIYTKSKRLSFYYSMIYAVSQVLNTIDNFKYRIRDGKVILHEKIHPSFTYINKDANDDLFKIITVDLVDDMAEFEKAAKETSEKQKNLFDSTTSSYRDDLIYITCIPWITFTHVSHPITLNKCDSVPRISWGKYYKCGEKTMLPFSVQVNHALADGFHVGKYIEKLQLYIDEIQ